MFGVAIAAIVVAVIAIVCGRRRTGLPAALAVALALSDFIGALSIVFVRNGSVTLNESVSMGR